MIHPVFVNFEMKYSHLAEEAKRAGILFSKNTLMWIIIDQNEIVGCFGLYLRGSLAVIKCVYVKPRFRGRGWQSKAISFLKGWTIENAPNVREIKANCTAMALNGHLRAGAEIVRKFKNGITEVKHQIQ